MTVASESGSMTSEWTDVQFTPRRSNETVGAVSARRGSFVFHGSANLDIQETVTEFWKQAEAAYAEHQRVQSLAALVEGMKP